jgi:hypothetical protein
LFDGLLVEGRAFDTDGKFVGVTAFDISTSPPAAAAHCASRADP